MTTKQEAQTLEETLNKTDFGHVINENKKGIIITATLIVVAIIIYSVINELSKSQRMDQLNRTFSVEMSIFKPYESGKIKAGDFITSLKGLNNELVGDIALIPSLLSSANKLYTDKAISPEFVKIFENWASQTDKSSYAYVFVALRLSSLYENTGAFPKAVETLEGLKNTKYTAFQEKVQFDLGRMYLLTNQQDKAKASFDYVIEHFKDGEFAKLSNLYLAKSAKKAAK